MMPIPRDKRKKKKFLKVCKEPGCEREFIGYGVTKYCDRHKDPKTRAKRDRAVSDHSHNAFIRHGFVDDVVVEISCRICRKPFRVRLSPKQFIYPAQCESCRHK